MILDACFTREGKPYGRRNFRDGDANIPPAELEWLRADLRKTDHKTLVCVHQCLDLFFPYGVHNGAAVCKVLKESGKVLGVLQGHFHFGNYGEVLGIPIARSRRSWKVPAPKNNAYAMLDLLPNDVIRITGFRKQRSYKWPT